MINTVAQFKDRVRSGFVKQDKSRPKLSWEYARRVTFPTGARGIVGEGVVTSGEFEGQTFLATLRYDSAGHSLTVVPTGAQVQGRTRGE